MGWGVWILAKQTLIRSARAIQVEGGQRWVGRAGGRPEVLARGKGTDVHPVSLPQAQPAQLGPTPHLPPVDVFPQVLAPRVLHAALRGSESGFPVTVATKGRGGGPKRSSALRRAEVPEASAHTP